MPLCLFALTAALLLVAAATAAGRSQGWCHAFIATFRRQSTESFVLYKPYND